MTTIETLVPEQLWQAIQPLLPAPAPRYERRADVLLGLVQLACALICRKNPNQRNATGPFGS